ncbi:uncharacterized protein LOC110982700 [Acanthaster planci]|uniref:Uncharacterized protein LOC110982700 n=1 Tax=Acanthaster planci TaxID=133434 RepID=A0A8B7Z0S1_ACAPL|nr:uncharacterized protein LOC110982700 [Acanthaster planci]
MTGTTATKMCVLLATFVVLLATLTEMANTMDLPYSEDENLPFGVMERPGGSHGAWQRRTVDILLEALTLLREEMDKPMGEDAQQVVKKGNSHYLFWRTPVITSRSLSEESSRKRSN